MTVPKVKSVLTTEAALQERAELIALIEQNQQQMALAQQRIAFLNGMLTERGIDLGTTSDTQSLAKQTKFN